MTTDLLPHIHPEFAPIAYYDLEERIKFIQSPRWIGYSKAKEITDILQTLLSYPTQDRMPNMLLIGEANNGKTSLLKRFASKFGEPIIINDTVKKPVLYIQANSNASEKDLYIGLLDGYNGVFNYSSSIAQLKHQAIHYIRNFHTRLIIIDEIHSLLSGSAKQQRQIMNAIKFLCNDLNIPFVLAGTRSALQVLHTDPQHISRFDVKELPLWKYDIEFARLVASLERVLPLKEPSNLIEPDKLMLIHELSKGCIGYTKRFIAESAINALKNGVEYIRLEDLQHTKKAFNR